MVSKANLVDSAGNTYEIVEITNFPYTDPKYFNRIDSVLKANGIVYSGFSMRENTIQIYVPNLNQETSIRQLVAQFTTNPNTQTPKEQAVNTAISDALTLIRAIAKKPRANRTDAEKIALGLALYVGSINQDDV